jgi:hypothetical protein
MFTMMSNAEMERGRKKRERKGWRGMEGTRTQR